MDMLNEGEQQGKSTKARESREGDHGVIRDLTDTYFRE